MSSDLSTPSKVNRSSCDRSHCLNEDVCSVCLSPVKSDHHSTPSSSSKGGPVQTICKVIPFLVIFLSFLFRLIISCFGFSTHFIRAVC